MASRIVRRLVEPHFHFLKPNAPFGAFVKKLGAPDFSPEGFEADAAGLNIVKAVHVECAPSDPLAEALYVESTIEQGGKPPVAGIVAACDLSAPEAAAELAALKAQVRHLVGIRYVVDYDGPFGEENATHPFVSRHADGYGVDFLRDPAHATSFEAGFAALAPLGLRFDLQCAPAQLEAAADLLGRHPDVPVVLDHLGKPRLGGGSAADAAELAVWRRGMAAVAAQPHAYCKLSMLGYALPRWAAEGEAAKEALARDLVLETIDLFGPHRCMFSTNWWLNGAASNSDFRDDVDVPMAELWRRYLGWVEPRYSAADVERLVAGTAEEFYGI